MLLNPTLAVGLSYVVDWRGSLVDPLAGAYRTTVLCGIVRQDYDDIRANRQSPEIIITTSPAVWSRTNAPCSHQVPTTFQQIQS